MSYREYKRCINLRGRTETTEKRTLAHCLGWTLFKRDTVHMLMPV